MLMLALERGRWAVSQKPKLVFAPFRTKNGYRLCLFWSGIGCGFRENKRECMKVFVALILHDELITLTMKDASQTAHPVFQAARVFWHQQDSRLDR